MDKCQSSHAEIYTESNLGLMKYQVCFYLVDPFRVLGLVIFMVQVLEGVVLWLIQKVLELRIN